MKRVFLKASRLALKPTASLSVCLSDTGLSPHSDRRTCLQTPYTPKIELLSSHSYSQIGVDSLEHLIDAYKLHISMHIKTLWHVCICTFTHTFICSKRCRFSLRSWFQIAVCSLVLAAVPPLFTLVSLSTPLLPYHLFSTFTLPLSSLFISRASLSVSISASLSLPGESC